MKTYHQYQSESKQAEQKLRTIQQQMSKMKSAKKQKAMEKRVEKVKRSVGVLWKHDDLDVLLLFVSRRDKWNTPKRKWKHSKHEMIIWWRSNRSMQRFRNTVRMMSPICSIAWTSDFTHRWLNRSRCIYPLKRISNEVGKGKSIVADLNDFFSRLIFQNDRDTQSSHRWFGHGHGQTEVFRILRLNIHHPETNPIRAAQRRRSLSCECPSVDPWRDAIAFRSNAEPTGGIENGKRWGLLIWRTDAWKLGLLPALVMIDLFTWRVRHLAD